MMSEVHFLNVREGDTILVRHGSSLHLTMIDICCGNYTPSAQERIEKAAATARVRGNFRMCQHPTNPIDYIDGNFGGEKPFRFILSHPDMDHLDGFNALMDRLGILNFWDSGVRKEKPDFSGGGFQEEDWDRYVEVRDQRDPTVTVVSPKQASKFQYANRGEDGEAPGDRLYVLSPDDALVNEANNDGEANDASYVILYVTPGGRFLFSGDAHDRTWEFVLENYEDAVRGCEVMAAPHHGRHSGRSFEFLDVVQPRLTLFGCAPSEDLAYDAWSRRDLPIITNNQAGNVVFEWRQGATDVYVENKSFARAVLEGPPARENRQGYYYITTIDR